MKFNIKVRRLIAIAMMVNMIFLLSGCAAVDGMIPLSSKQIDNHIIDTLNEKYPNHTFSITSDNGTLFNIQDENAVEFQVTVEEANKLQFWCKDNYIASYFVSEGRLDEFNELLSTYGVGDQLEKDDVIEVTFSNLDDDYGLEDMGNCFYQMGMLLNIPFDVTYFDRGTPQAAESYQGSTTEGFGNVCVISCEYNSSHIITRVDENRLFLKDIQEMSLEDDYIDYLSEIERSIEDRDIVAEAINPQVYSEIIDIMSRGERPADVLGMSYGDFTMSLDIIFGHYKSDYHVASAQVTERDDSEETLTLVITDEMGEEYTLNLGSSGDYKYHIESGE